MIDPKDKFRCIDDLDPEPDMARPCQQASGPQVVSDRIEPDAYVKLYGLRRRVREALRLLFTGRVWIG